MTKRVLVVDDEATIRRTVEAYLVRDGFEVQTAVDGRGALAAARQFDPDLVVLDIMLPELDGYEVLRRLRRDSDVHVILLTARADEADVVVGLGIGADDYVTKPFSPRELSARVRAVLRRGSDPDAAAPVSFGAVRIDRPGRRVWRGDEAVDLTATEFDLLAAFADHEGRVLSRGQLIQLVWGHDYYGDERVVDVHIRRIRKKIEDDPSAPALILTVRGVGYRFETPQG
ncbi:MAG: winged helix-turn-helix domain-containing protein [Anaerolineae bacterium]